MELIWIILICLLAYGLGSIATAVWAGKIFHKIDIREHGSGNAGATNTIRVTGWTTGILVLIIDMAKGWLAASLPVLAGVGTDSSPTQINYQIICGLIAIVGHVFPVFAGFRGGKGVATTFGVLLALHPMVTFSSLGVFLGVLFITGYVSASSISAGVSFPLILLFFFDSPSLIFTIFSVIIAIAIILTHRKNISRLLAGEERRFLWKNRRRKSQN
ncbi:MAG TPA: glycerol-3-phosphate 1-O-acyltransferase PlsY [Bacteroidales bacterium]|nr:glycerol-3-phosphate 1-O-acyltransferase PlsY [Bacteroidales bacterium]